MEHSIFPTFDFLSLRVMQLESQAHGTLAAFGITTLRTVEHDGQLGHLLLCNLLLRLLSSAHIPIRRKCAKTIGQKQNRF